MNPSKKPILALTSIGALSQTLAMTLAISLGYAQGGAQRLPASQAELFLVQVSVKEVPVVGSIEQRVHISLETDASGGIRGLDYRVEMNTERLDKATKALVQGTTSVTDSASASKLPKVVQEDMGKVQNVVYTGHQDLRTFFTPTSSPEEIDLEFAKLKFDPSFSPEKGGKMDLIFPIDREKKTKGQVSILVKPKGESSPGQFEAFFVNRAHKWERFTTLMIESTAKPDVIEIMSGESGNSADALNLEVKAMTFTSMDATAVTYSSKELGISP
jgi:hypothetical protein